MFGSLHRDPGTANTTDRGACSGGAANVTNDRNPRKLFHGRTQSLAAGGVVDGRLRSKIQSAAPDGLEDYVLLSRTGFAGNHENRNGKPRHDAFDCRQTVHSRHLKVDQEKVGASLLYQIEDGASVGRFSHDLDVTAMLE
jgi:hypothetical protein